MPVFLRQIKEAGFSGVQNFPTVGLFDGVFRANIEATGMGYDKEVEMIRLAREIDLFTSPYVFNPDEARAMVNAGGDLLVCHVGLTTAGSIGAAVAMTLDEAINKTMEMAETIWSIKKDALVICHGGPFDEPDNVAQALKQMPELPGFTARPARNGCPPSAPSKPRWKPSKLFNDNGRGGCAWLPAFMTLMLRLYCHLSTIPNSTTIM